MPPRSSHGFLLTLVLIFAATAMDGGQLAPPFQVANLNTTPNEILSGGGGGPVAMGDDVYFLAWGGLWRTDGTSRGTYFVTPSLLSTPFVFGRQLVFGKFEGSKPKEVWVTDGTTPNTFKIADGYLYGGSACGDAFCFGTGGAALRITDGTAAGTRVLAYTENDVSDTNLPINFATLGRQLYFNGFDWAHGRCLMLGPSNFCGELWTSDGTAAGTRLVTDLNPGPTPSSPRDLFVNGNKLYYSALTFREGQQPARCPYVIDGVGALPRRLSEECETYDADPLAYFSVRGRTYYQTLGYLWITDGTPEGTQRLNQVLGLSGDSHVLDIAAARDRLVLMVFTPLAMQVWSSDFEHGSLTHLFDIQAFANLIGTTHTGDVLLQGVEFTHGPRELWTTDGTVAGSKLLRSASGVDAYFGHIRASRFDFFTSLGGGVTKMWQTDGTPQGTRWVETTAPRDEGSLPAQLTGARSQLFFFASVRAGDRGLYRADARGDGVRRLMDCPSCSALAASGDRLYFRNGEAWWTSDGTAAGTEPLAEWLHADVQPWMIPVDVGGRPVFVGQTPSASGIFAIAGETLAPVATLPPVGASVLHAIVGGRLVFFAASGLWSSDGTAAGTQQIAPVAGYVSDLTSGGERAFYRVSETIWVTDGTAAGTHSVVTKSALFLAARKGVLFFIDTFTGSLWRTDGTTEGTFELPRSTTENFAHAIDAGPHLALMTHEKGGNVDVWTSDGTREGTVFVRRLPSGFYEPGKPFLGPDGDAYTAYRSTRKVHLANLSGRPDHEASFPMIDPLVNGSLNPSDIVFASTDEALFFAANSLPYGAELWALRLDGGSRHALPELRVENATMTELDGGRRMAVFRVRMSGVETAPVTVSFATSDGSAVAGRDYTATAGTLTFGGYETTKAVVVPVSAASKGTFWLTLSNAGGATIANPIAAAATTESDRRRVVRR